MSELNKFNLGRHPRKTLLNITMVGLVAKLDFHAELFSVPRSSGHNAIEIEGAILLVQ